MGDHQHVLENIRKKKLPLWKDNLMEKQEPIFLEKYSPQVMVALKNSSNLENIEGKPRTVLTTRVQNEREMYYFTTILSSHWCRVKIVQNMESDLIEKFCNDSELQKLILDSLTEGIVLLSCYLANWLEYEEEQRDMRRRKS